MGNLKLRKLANFRNLAGVLISAALAPAICAQGPRQLQVEVGPNQQIRILAKEVSYGEVLRALRVKSGWEIEIPPSADELKLSYVHVETTQPSIALGKLLESSGLGFVFLSLEDETGISNVIVNPNLYEKYRVVINREKFLRVEGVLQNQDPTISIKASRVLPISLSAAETN